MICVHCGAYYPYPSDHNHQHLCANCTFHEKQLRLQQQLVNNVSNNGSNHAPQYSQSSVGSTIVSILYLIGIIVIGGGIWVEVESIFGDTGFTGFVLSMLGGLLGVSFLVSLFSSK